LASRTCAVPTLLILIAVAAVAFGVFARLYDIDRMIIWHDEVFSVLRMLGFDDIFLLTPSAVLRIAMSVVYELVPVLDTWQWYQAVLKTPPVGT